MKTLVVIAGFAGALVACASPDGPAIDHARPPWGPMAGGTTVEILGNGFDPDVNRVFVGGREAAVVRTVDDQHLDIVIPPSERAGDAEIVVVTSRDNVIANGVFSYSEPPTIDSISPAKVMLSAPSTTITVRGRGFLDEEAGPPTVVVNGQPIDEVVVRNDSAITFEAPPGIAFTRPEIEVTNQRGSSRMRGYRYELDDRPGILVFNYYSDSFAQFYEPVSGTQTAVPRTSTARPCMYAVLTDTDGEMWASDSCSFGDYAFARVDLEGQLLVEPHVTGRLYTAVVHHRDRYYAINYSVSRFGTMDVNGESFKPIDTTFHGFYEGLGSDGKTMWLVANSSVRTIDPDTGTLGVAQPLSISISVTDVLWFGGLLYATNDGGSLYSIDPATGVTAYLGYVGTTYAMIVIP